MIIITAVFVRMPALQGLFRDYCSILPYREINVLKLIGNYIFHHLN